MKPVLIEINQDRPGFNHFIGSWLYQGEMTILIDVGPASSSGRLIQFLRDMDLESIPPEFVLLKTVCPMLKVH